MDKICLESGYTWGVDPKMKTLEDPDNGKARCYVTHDKTLRVDFLHVKA